jgi:hypothetical protein
LAGGPNTWFVQTRGTDYDAKNQFAWMTVIDFKADREVAYPFKGWGSLAGRRGP